MNCVSCVKPLTLVSGGSTPMRRKDDWTVQYDNALAITFLGGYGMFFDDIDLVWGSNSDRRRTLVICHDCAHALIAANPWMRIIVDDNRGHGHDGKAHLDEQV